MNICKQTQCQRIKEPGKKEGCVFELATMVRLGTYGLIWGRKKHAKIIDLNITNGLASLLLRYWNFHRQL